MTDQQYLWYLVINALVAFGTIGAVVVAVGQALRVKFWPPKLKVSLLNTVGEKVPYFTDPHNQQLHDARYYHLAVRNERRWSPATGVSLYLTRIDEPGPDGNPQTKWSGDIPIRCRHQELYPLTREIGSPIHYDLCCISKDPRALSLMPILVPTNLPLKRTTACTFIALFQARSAQSDSDVAPVQIAWDGKWEDGDREMQDHLKIKTLA